MLKVLLVDDSSTARTLLRHIVNTGDNLRVVAEATDGIEAIGMVRRQIPDVILMDAMMPRMDGLEATRAIMEKSPTPIVVISSAADDAEANLAFKAIRAGALTVLSKPHGPSHPNYDMQARKIQRTLRSMASVHVIHHRAKKPKPPTLPAGTPLERGAQAQIVGIVSSTGGPGVLSQMLESLPADYPLPVVIVQHISRDFSTSLVKWLDSVSKMPVALAQQNQLVEAGRVYIAPTDAHLRITSARRFDLNPEPQKTFTPSGDILLESIAAVYGPLAIGIILTGMGDDGVEGMASLYGVDAMTIAQDEESAVVFGMPAAAIERGVIRQVFSPSSIVGYLLNIATHIA